MIYRKINSYLLTYLLTYSQTVCCGAKLYKLGGPGSTFLSFILEQCSAEVEIIYKNGLGKNSQACNVYMPNISATKCCVMGSNSDSHPLSETSSTFALGFIWIRIQEVKTKKLKRISKNVPTKLLEPRQLKLLKPLM